jgi:predicted CopG family antitoxin
MPNQYSITVSEEADRILKEMKKKGHKLSQVIDAAIKSIQEPGLTRMVAVEKRIKQQNEEAY